MRRFILLPPALLAALAGCTGPTGEDAGADLGEPGHSSEPLHLSDSIDLLQGANGVTWRFDVGPGATDAQVAVVLRGLSGAPAWLQGRVCVELKGSVPNGTVEGSAGDCGPGNLSLPPPVRTGEHVLLRLHRDDLPPGSYTLILEAEPQAAEASIHIDVSYA